MRDVPAAPEAFRSELEPDERLLWHSQPGARGLFFSVLPRLLRDLVFLSLVVAAILFGWERTNDGARAIVILFALFLLYSLFREIRETTAAKISHYLITDRRLIIILPRVWMGNRSILRGQRPSRYDASGLPTLTTAGRATSGKLRSGRATITVPVRGYITVPSHAGGGVEGYRTFTLKLIAVTEPDAALALLRHDP